MKHAWILLLVFAWGLPALAADAPAGQNTVLWVSIDGLRHDLLDRVRPPNLMRLQSEAAYTNQEIPIFPSLTFPNHIAQVTGTTVDHHGIPMNSFFDTATHHSYSFPGDGLLLRSEPIWVTAKRQGVRVEVIDWPMSDSQPAGLAADYSNSAYDTQETDAHRFAHVVDILRHDSQKPPLRLIMSYAPRVDQQEHKYGPNTPEVDRTLLDLDRSLGQLIAATTAWFDATHGPGDELYVLLTTDHGMERVKSWVNLERLIGADLMKGGKVVSSGPIATSICRACLQTSAPPVPRRSSRNLRRLISFRHGRRQRFPRRFITPIRAGLEMWWHSFIPVTPSPLSASAPLGRRLVPRECTVTTRPVIRICRAAPSSGDIGIVLPGRTWAPSATPNGMRPFAPSWESSPRRPPIPT